jgi:hypothetical protein
MHSNQPHHWKRRHFSTFTLSLALAATNKQSSAFSNPTSFASRQFPHITSTLLRDDIGYYQPPYNSSNDYTDDFNIRQESEDAFTTDATYTLFDQDTPFSINEQSQNHQPPLPRGFTYEEYYTDPEISGSIIADASSSSTTSTSSDLCAPEINKWTTLMTSGTNAAIHRPGPAMTLQEGMEILYNDLKDLTSHDYQMIEGYWDDLLPTVSYLGSYKAERIKQALRVAYRAHLGQMRKSGEPFIIHPVEVALLLSGMKMDAETVMAGLLHDTVEDTDLTFEQVEAMFGKEVRNIVEGETKVSKLPKLAFAEYADEQAENLRQMFIAMTDDYRIIIVKVSDAGYLSWLVHMLIL